jgi:hypothetical protein
MQRTLAGRLRTFADLNFLIVNVRQQLSSSNSRDQPWLLMAPALPVEVGHEASRHPRRLVRVSPNQLQRLALRLGQVLKSLI